MLGAASRENKMNNNSIIKTTTYWLPEELWGVVKDYMGFVNFKKKEVRWDLMPKLKIEDLAHIGIGIPTFCEYKYKFQIDAKGNVLIDYKKKGYIKPKELQFIVMKRRAMKWNKMKPLAWAKLSSQLVKRLKPFDILRVNDKFRIKCNNPAYWDKQPVCEVKTKTKNKIGWSCKTNGFWEEDIPAGVFNKEFCSNGIVILTDRH